MNKDMEI